MASLRQIRRRLRSIHSTKQIMRAMQLVSGSKLKRAQARLQQTKVVFDFLDGLLQRVLVPFQLNEPNHTNQRIRSVPAGPFGRPSAEIVGTALASVPLPQHPLCAKEEGKPSALVLWTSDTGLCGSYNTNLIHLAESYLRRDSLKSTQLIYVGKKGHRYFTKRGYAATEAYLDLAGRPTLANAETIGRALMQRFLSGRVGSVQLLYSQFISSTASRPTMTTWLPISFSRQQPADSRQIDYIFEPSAQRVFEDLLPRWALAKFAVIMLEAFASEHSARMMAMKNATDNAEELLESLTRQRNKVRQATITKELAEIVGTAEALK